MERRPQRQASKTRAAIAAVAAIWLLAHIPSAPGAGREVGSKACEPCHTGIYRSYFSTPMGLSSGVMGSGMIRESFAQGEFASPGGGVQYQVGQDSDGPFFRFRQGELEGFRRLDFFIGSGAVGRSYLRVIGKALFQAPVSYYTSAQKWDVSPGFERAEEVNLLRGVEPGCLRCHASRVQSVAGTVNVYEAPAFLEGGIACERCHGPGEDHIARIKTGKQGQGSGIVNPGRLEPARRDSVCAQCHLSGEAEIARAGAPAYRPGERLSDSSAVFVWSSSRGMKVNSHFERLAQSACWRAAGDKMWCGSCHDVHRLPEASEAPAYYRERCMNCHTGSSCSAPKAARAERADACASCHMPRSEVRTVQHAVFTDHSIPRQPAPSAGTQEEGVPRDAVLALFWGGEPADRELGLAWASVALRENNRAWGMRAFELLRKASREHPSDGKVALQLAQIYDRMGNEAEACRLYAAAVEVDRSQPAALVNLGGCLAREGRIPESIQLWQEALGRSPGLEGARINMAVAQYRSGDAAAAKATLQEALTLNPASRRAAELQKEIEQAR
jgi:hypothetical protein